MNEPQLRRLLRRIVLLSAPLPLAVFGAACGGTALVDSEAGGSANALAGADAGGAEITASAGSGGIEAGGAELGGSVGTRAGSGGSAGASLGLSGSAGASAGSGGSAGASAGSGDSAGASAGAAGDFNAGLCRSSFFGCGGGLVTIPRTCVSSLVTAGTPLPLASCGEICSRSLIGSCSVTVATESSVTVLCPIGCGGRRPAGIIEPLAPDGGVGGYFAAMAGLEQASVTAFRILRDELRAHGAPKRLVRAAARAARDEIRHARATGALARRFGAVPVHARLEPSMPRSIEAMAVENAVEGCVREAYGALLATYQVSAARDPIIRAQMTRIARDETRHAALSLRVGRWLERRLDRAAKLEVDRARQAAVRELLTSLAAEHTPSFADAAGLPAPALALALARQMQHTLWS